MPELDQYDLKILALLQENNRLTSEEIAETIHLSPTACQRRMKRLRADGVIARDISVLSPEAAGRRLVAIVQIVLGRGGAETIQRFKREVQRHPEIQQCYYVTGEHDFVLIVTAEDMADYDRLTQELFFANPDVQKFHTTVVLDSVKVGLQVPLPVSL